MVRCLTTSISRCTGPGQLVWACPCMHGTVVPAMALWRSTCTYTSIVLNRIHLVVIYSIITHYNLLASIYYIWYKIYWSGYSSSLCILSSIQEKKNTPTIFEQVIRPFVIYELAKTKEKKCCTPLSNKHKLAHFMHAHTVLLLSLRLTLLLGSIKGCDLKGAQVARSIGNNFRTYE